MKKTAQLNNWILGDIETTHGKEKALFGECYGHPGVLDGNRALTSRVLSISPDNTIAETNNTIYTLGRPSEIHRDDFTAWQQFYSIRTKAILDARENYKSHEEPSGGIQRS